MINNDYKSLFYDSGSDHRVFVSIDGKKIADNSSIEFESFELEEALCSESDLTFGSCESNCIKLVLRGIPSILGKEIVVSEEITGSGLDPFIYGKYVVTSDVPTSDKTKREITAYDSMYGILNCDVKFWYSSLSFPMSLRQFRDSFFSYVGIEQVGASLVNDGVVINKTLVTTNSDSNTITSETTISGKKVITAICEINGCFGNINRDGKFEYVILNSITSALYPSENLYPSDEVFPSDSNAESMTGKYIEFDYENFQTRNITQLEIRNSSESSGEIVGTTGNNYVISGNFLVSDKSGDDLRQIADNILSVINKASFIPVKSSNCVGNPCLMLGDPIRFNTSREIIETYILQRTLSGIQAKRDSFVSSGNEYYSEKVNSVKNEIDSLKGKANKLERTADHTLSELADLDENTSSRFEQTANAITAEVTARQGADSQISASLELKIDKTDDGTIISLINGSANKINFTASNMFTVSAPNFSIDAAGNVQMGGQIIADTAMYLCYNYASLPGMAFATKINALGLSGGSYSEYGISGYDILESTNTAIGVSSPILSIGNDAVVVKVKTQLQASSMYSDVGIFKDIGLTFVIGDNGGRIYKCMGATGNYGLASAGWVKNWAAAQNYAKKSDIPSVAGFITGITVNDRGNSAAAEGKYTSYLYLAVGSSGIYSSVSGFHILASDRRMKDFVIDAPDIAVAYMALRPVHFKFKDDAEGVDQHWHYGFIAQEVKDAFNFAGLDTYGEALVGYDEENDMWLLDKSEMHAMHVQMIQKQQREIDQLKRELDELKQKMEGLSNVILSKNNQF